MFLGTDPFNIIMTIFAVIILLVLIFGMYKLVIHEEKKYSEEKNILSEKLVSKAEFKDQVQNTIARVGSFGSFTACQIEIEKYDELLDTFGKAKINIVLKLMSDRISEISKNYIATLLSDGKFLVLFKKEVNYDELNEDMSYLIETLSASYQVGYDDEVTVAIVVGVATYPTCGSNYKELLQSLELATYVARKNGVNTYSLYSTNIEEEESSNLESYKEVRRAIENNEFCLHYQPIINIQERKLLGFESFLRWNHPTLGVIQPNKFIHILEQSGDINTLNRWGIEAVCQELVEIDSFTGTDEIIISINLSTKQLMSDNILDEFKKIVTKYKISPNRICLEIGEYALYEKVNSMHYNLLRLRDFGFRISVDGLGLDYNVLSKLEREPIDMIKLDKGFLEDITNNYMNEKFAEILVESSANLNRLVIAECVETNEHVRYILNHNIVFGQGYYFSKPLEAAAVMSYIKEASYQKQIEESFKTE